MTYPCVCCGILNFKSQVKDFMPHKFDQNMLNKIVCTKLKSIDHPNYLMCHKCFSSVEINRVPFLALSNNLDFPTIENSIKNLSSLEETMCSPRVFYTNVKQINKNQVSNTVLVPNDKIGTIKLLPRQFEQTNSIQIKSSSFDKRIFCENFRPENIFNGLKWQVSSEVVLYKDDELIVKLPFSKQKINDKCFEWKRVERFE